MSKRVAEVDKIESVYDDHGNEIGWTISVRTRSRLRGMGYRCIEDEDEMRRKAQQ